MTKKGRLSFIFLLTVVGFGCFGCQMGEKQFKEQQLTHGNEGYFLNQAQVFSSNDHWIVFDHGVQGPRQWMRSMPDGSLIFFPMKDDAGLVQIFAVSPNGGPIKQITENDFSLETSFSIDPDGNYWPLGIIRIFI